MHWFDRHEHFHLKGNKVRHCPTQKVEVKEGPLHAALNSDQETFLQASRGRRMDPRQILTGEKRNMLSFPIERGRNDIQKEAPR